MHVAIARPSLHAIPPGYVQAPPDVMRHSGRFPGLLEDRQGNTYAVDGANVYTVRHDADNATWRVCDPRAPSRPTYPIRPGEDGGWALHGDVGLRGGMFGGDDAVAGPSGRKKKEKKEKKGESFGESANRWFFGHDKNYTSITKKYDPGHLNLSAFEHKEVKVSDDVFRTLGSAQKINEQINAFLPYGSGNQHWDLQATGGESLKRVQVHRDPPPGMASVFSDGACGAGNCDEKSALAFRMAGADFPKSPVMQVSECGGVDHTYVLIGDPRHPAYGKSTVVVDAWPSFPGAHTLGTGVERPFLESAEMSRHEPFSLKHSSSMPTDRIDAAFTKVYGSSAKREDVLRDVYADDAEDKWVWTQRTSGHDMSTRYSSPSHAGGAVMDRQPDYVVDRYDPFVKRNDDHNGPLFPARKPL